MNARRPRIDVRALGRATLARQLLLERSPLPVPAAVAHLVGLQAQTPQTWYVGLWSRLVDLDPGAVAALLDQRVLVRVPVMRSTIHLLTAEDALGLRPLTQPAIERSTAGNFGRRLAGVDPAALATAARSLVDVQPLTAAALGRRLQESFPDADPDALAQGARAQLPMVQVPPRGMWGRSGQARLTPLETWLERPMGGMSPTDLVTRYLAAFGPATVRDAQTWSGLTRLSEIVEGMRPHLWSGTGPDGEELLDLPDAPRPRSDHPAPVRFLYDFDNLLLSHADRRRVLGGLDDADYAAQGYGSQSQRQPATVLVDGMVAATWTVGTTRAAATLDVRPFHVLRPDQRDGVEAEGTALLGMLHPALTAAVRIR